MIEHDSIYTSYIFVHVVKKKRKQTMKRFDSQFIFAFYKFQIIIIIIII